MLNEGLYYDEQKEVTQNLFFLFQFESKTARMRIF